MITGSASRTRTVRRITKELTCVADHRRLCPVSIHQTMPREKLEHARKSPFRVVCAAVGWVQSLGEAEKQPQVLWDLSMRMPSDLFRTGSRPQFSAMLAGADLAEHSSANSLKIAPVINDNSGVMLLWCIGDAVHR